MEHSTGELNLVDEISGKKKPHLLYKKAIFDFNQSIKEQFEQGVSANQLIADRSFFIDTIIQSAWGRFHWNENLTSWRKSRISLLAVGGYGRAELHPHSDIDLLILLERSNYDLHRENIQSVITLLWDIGLEVGHSVRSMRECRSQASKDVTVLTALMEARTIAGDDELCSKILKQTSPDKVWTPKKFYRAKLNEQEVRHTKFNHTEYSLEPDVKNSPGGLRDIQTLLWVTSRNFGTTSIHDLIEKKILTKSEGKALIRGRDLLWKIRFGLHLLAKKKDDRLFFEHQQAISKMFGYRDSDQLAVEQFMQDYYRTALDVNHINRLLLRHFDELITKKKSKITPINERFQLRNDFLEVSRDTVFRENPTALIEMFVILGNREDIHGVHSKTIRLVRQHTNLIDDDFRESKEVTSLFLELLRSKYHLFTQLRRMERYGILGTYLPEFGRIIGQMQFDLFHIYTVDAHTLQVVRNMRRFRYKNQEQQFPIAAHIHHQLPKVELLYIAGLYHDIAKGLRGDHSKLGVVIVRQFCERHRLGTWDTNLVCWLVENHLMMSTIAQRKDIQNPSVIREFALKVQDQIRLDYLYSLTVADINATNPNLWNSWRASLMRQLYLETRKLLRTGLENHVDRNDYLNQVKTHAIERLVEHQITRDETIRIWRSLDDDYFLSESISNIVWQTSVMKAYGLSDSPVISIRDVTHRRRNDEGATQIFVYMKNAPRIFASIVSTLDALALDVVDAKIVSSTSEVVLDTFTVLDLDGAPVGNKPFRKERIRTKLLKNLGSPHKPESSSMRRTSRALKHFMLKTEVTIVNNKENSILNVVAPDRPGLLAVIADIFVEMEITLISARITTLGERVEDVFHVSKEGAAIPEGSLRQLLMERICQELDSHIAKVAI